MGEYTDKPEDRHRLAEGFRIGYRVDERRDSAAEVRKLLGDSYQPGAFTGGSFKSKEKYVKEEILKEAQKRCDEAKARYDRALADTLIFVVPHGYDEGDEVHINDARWWAEKRLMAAALNYNATLQELVRLQNE